MVIADSRFPYITLEEEDDFLEIMKLLGIHEENFHEVEIEVSVGQIKLSDSYDKKGYDR